MNLYNRIPEKLFSILASKNKKIYSRALMSLYDAFKVQWNIKKSEFVVRLIDDLDELLVNMVIEEEQVDKTSSGYAHYIVRVLKENGWIEIEYADDNFDEMIMVPDYASKILKVLHEIANDNKDSEYNRYVYSTYSVLKTSADSSQNYMTAVDSAYTQTMELLDKLRMLLSNIKRYHRQLSEFKNTNKILVEHFDDFKATLADKIYYPIKTFDSVHRYKTPILQYLKSWLYDEDILEAMAEEVWARESKKKSSSEESVKAKAKDDGISNINKIIDIYERMDELLKVIDNKNTEYTRATLERIEFLLNTDRSVKGKVKEIIKQLVNDDTDKWYNSVENVLVIYNQKLIDHESLYKPRDKKNRENIKREKIKTDIDKEAVFKETSDFTHSIRKMYNQNKVQKYILSLMNERKEINSKEIPVTNDEQFISTLLGVLIADDKESTYSVNFNNEDEIKKKDYIIPDFTIKKKLMK